MSCPNCRGHRPWPVLIGLLLAIVLLTAAYAGEPPLKLQDAARLASARHPQIDAQTAAVEALELSAIAAGQWPDPKLRVGLASLPLDSFSFTQDAMTELTLAVSQTLPGGNKAHLAEQRGVRETEQARLQVDAIRRRIAREASLAWLSAWWPEAAMPLIQAIEAEWQRQIEWAEVAYKTGKLAQDEVVAMRTQRIATRDRLDELTRQRQLGRALLRRWLGEAGERPLAELDTGLEPNALQALRDGVAQHPELAVLSAAVAVTRAEAAQAREAYQPDITLDLGYGLRGGGQPDFISVGVGLDLPLFPAKRQDRRLLAREARVTQAEQNLADRRQALLAELEENHAEWLAANARRLRYEQEILPLARQQVSSALNAYGSDRTSFARVAEARRAELEARLNVLAQRVAQAKARVQIDYLTLETQS